MSRRAWYGLSAGAGLIVAGALIASLTTAPRRETFVSPGIAAPPAAIWSAYGGGPGGGQYSPLDQINRDNVAGLAVAWTYRTGDVSNGSDGSHPTTFEANPILAQDTLYFCTPFNRVIALDPADGTERWTFDAEVDHARSHLGAHICRGVAYWPGDGAPGERACARRIFEATGDGRLMALDASTGIRCAEFGSAGAVDLNAYDYSGEGRVGSTSPPAIYRDTVIVGNAIPSYDRSNAADGIVRAFDARSGKQLWEWNPVPEPLRDQVGGGNVWAPMSVDVERGLVFLPTSSPTPDTYGSQRTEPLPYTNALVALQAGTGTPVWHFQMVHHDLFDYDLPAQPALVAMQRDGESHDAVIQLTKQGFIYVFDRANGNSLFPIEEQPVPASDVPGEASSPTQPVPSMPAPFARQSLQASEAWGLTFWDRGKCRDAISALRNEGLFTPPSLRGSLIVPNTSGGGNWGGVAFEPVRNLAVVNSMDLAFSSRLTPRETFRGSTDGGHGRYDHFGPLSDTPYVWESSPLMSPFGIPCTPPPWGTLTAVDLSSGETRWQIPLGRVPLFGPFRSPESLGGPNVGGPMITGGGLVFIAATMDGAFRAYSVESGEQLWETELPAPGTAVPMTYLLGGRQYVVIAAGGHAAMGGALGDSLVAFALPTR